jgi:hypothetical protein
MLELIDRILGPECPEMNSYITLDDYLRYQSSITHAEITVQHIDAYWTLRDVMFEKDAASHGSGMDALFHIVLQDPSRAAAMKSIVSDRGVIDAETMLALIDIAGQNPTALLDGVL